jgi:hypothetical protein
MDGSIALQVFSDISCMNKTFLVSLGMNLVACMFTCQNLEMFSMILITSNVDHTSQKCLQTLVGTGMSVDSQGCSF